MRDDQYVVQLPDFLRIAWVSERAKSVWASRLAAVAQAWQGIEVKSVLEGVRKCAITRVNGSFAGDLADLAASAGCSSRLLPTLIGDRPSSLVGICRDSADLDRLASSSDIEALGQLLGYPPCCIEKHIVRASPVSRSFGEWASVTKPADLASRTETIEEEYVEVTSEDMELCNQLWSVIGIRQVPHEVCSINCKRSYSQAETFRKMMDSQIAEWSEQLFSWPVEWSALHGIGELRSPILKLAFPTVATLRKKTIWWRGSQFPTEGAHGVRFPFNQYEAFNSIASHSHHQLVSIATNP